jgi:hypothetical protein
MGREGPDREGDNGEHDTGEHDTRDHQRLRASPDIWPPDCLTLVSAALLCGGPSSRLAAGLLQDLEGGRAECLTASRFQVAVRRTLPRYWSRASRSLTSSLRTPNATEKHG